ncbi:uncharacterized [Tachysurus ichikawai]
MTPPPYTRFKSYVCSTAEGISQLKEDRKRTSDPQIYFLRYTPGLLRVLQLLPQVSPVLTSESLDCIRCPARCRPPVKYHLTLINPHWPTCQLTTIRLTLISSSHLATIEPGPEPGLTEPLQ